MEIRNIAIIAHVDHGKTTLTDALMKQNGGFQDEELSMDSNALEKERGITIYAKNTSIYYPSINSGRTVSKINIVDTPGHADFGSEVERILRAVDSVLLLVDSVEGPMPQTRFVLKKSLELGLKPIVVINKIDKPAAEPNRVHDEILELFFELGASEEQANFETVYTIGREGKAFKKLGDDSKDLSPLLEVILEKVSDASLCQGSTLTYMSRLNPDIQKMSAQVFNLGYDNFLGRMAVARIYSGSILSGNQIFIKGENGTRKGRITKLFTFEGITRREVETASSGDIVLLAGIPDIYIGETLCGDENLGPLPHIAIDEPTLSLNFLVNDSPFAGREGKFVTSRQIKERLKKELEINVGLKVDFSPFQSENKMGPSFFKVYGRGELHIAILLENMRREGFEMQVSQPEVIIKEKNGIKTEPYEELIIDVPIESSGIVIEKIGKRRGIMKNMVEKQGIARIIFDIPTRGLLGYRGEFIIDTKGEGIMFSRVTSFREYAGEIKKYEYGSMTSMVSGKAVAFSLANLQEHGILYVEHGDLVYEGMVVGNVLKGDDMSVNPTKGKQLTNMRASGTDEAITLNPVFILNIERGLEVMNEDEYLEITPKSVRLRKKYLTELDRKKHFLQP